MSISLGIYDLFSYAIPGMLYLYIVNEVLKLVDGQYIDVAQLSQSGNAAPSAVVIVLLAVGSYVTGHIFEGLRAPLLDRWLYYYGAQDRVLKRIEQRLSHSGLKIDFHGDEWSVYLKVLQVRTSETIQEAERLKANGLMMRNLSFGAFLFAVLQLVQFLFHTNVLLNLIPCLIAFFVMIITYQRSKRFDEWSYGDIYLQALAYGPNLKEFLKNEKPAWDPEKKVFERGKKLKERD